MRRRSWAVRLARLYCRWRVGRAFEGVWIAGLEGARARLREGPLVLASTHVAWWDGLVMLLVDAALGAEGHVLVEADTVRRLPWLARIGALPLVRGVAARAGLRAAAATLDRPGRVVWVFPQGRQRPAWLRPLGVRPGVTMLASMAGAPIVPVALTYAFREGERPEVVVDLGPAVPGEEVEAALLSGLTRVDRFLDGEAAGFEPLLGGAGRRTDRGMGARVLGWLTR